MESDASRMYKSWRKELFEIESRETPASDGLDPTRAAVIRSCLWSVEQQLLREAQC